MSSFNRLIILGNLTRDPQTSYTPNQVSVVEFGMATNRKWVGSDGQNHEKVCFVDCKAFGKVGEAIAQYCRKGGQLLVEGELEFDQWEAQDGSKRSKHRMAVKSFTFVGGPRQEAEPDGEQAEQQPPVTDNDIPF